MLTNHSVTSLQAIKKVVAAMTMGKDVSSLFADVVNCVQANSLEIKKLVYLYVINYAKVRNRTLRNLTPSLNLNWQSWL
jgi:AP-1 complex subunit beta-1